MWRVVDRWRTQNGTWDVKPENEFGIDQEHSDFYLKGRDIPGAGADHHIFVKARRGMRVRFRTNHPTTPQDEVYTVPESGWVNHIMSSDSAYDPDKGERGPWIVSVDGIDVADGIGLPKKNHVSTFLVMGNDRGNPPPTPTDPAEPPKEPGEWKREKVMITVQGVTIAWEALVRRDK